MSASVKMPVVPDRLTRGMNNGVIDKRDLDANVWQVVENTFAAITGKPRNGVNDKIFTQVAPGYGSEHVYYKQRPIQVRSSEGDNFIFSWAQNDTTKDEYCLEVFNVTDNTKTTLILADFDNEDVHFGMINLHNAIYLIMDYEIQTNRSTPANPIYNPIYQTKNKIIEFDPLSSTWLVREMMIDVSPAMPAVEQISFPGQPWSARQFHTTVVFKGAMWIIGGQSIERNADVWKSIDGGKTWEMVIFDAGFTERSGHSTVVYDGKMWVLGGYDGANYLNDCWSSADGESWTQVDASADWSVRAFHSSLVYDGKMWVLGGRDSSGGISEAYYTTDGDDWTLATAAASFGTRYAHCSVVFDSKMWVISGQTGSSTFVQTAYSSTDGVTWTLVSSGSPLSGGGSIYVFQGVMYIALGYNGAAYTASVYSSSDGVTWTLSTSDSGIDVRSGGSALLWLGIPLIIAGKGSITYADVWETANGYDFTERQSGLEVDKYVGYAFSFVRREDEDILLESIDDYQYEKWVEVNGETVPGLDELLLTGTVSLSGTTLTGVGTKFTDELSIMSYIRIDGTNKKYSVSFVTSDTTATVLNPDGDSYVSKECSSLPVTDSYRSSRNWVDPLLESVVDTEEFEYLLTTDVGSVNVIPVISMPDVTKATAQGATHLRIYRTLLADDYTTVIGLSFRFVADVAILGDTYSPKKKYIDYQSDNSLSGQTHTLDMVGYSVPPQGRFNVWSGGRQWIGGNVDNPGYWFHSEVALNSTVPNRYSSMFKPAAEDGAYYIKCEPDDGQRDTGVIEFQGDLYFFKEKKIFFLPNSDPENSPDKISSDVGCAFPESIIPCHIPEMGGECVFFLSSLGPAFLLAGGIVKLFTDFGITEFFPGGECLDNSDGTPTSWYTRNSVTTRFWQNAIWIFFGDSRNGDIDISTNKCFCFRWNRDGRSQGASQLAFAEYNSSTVYEPQSLTPIDNSRAYTLSHCPDDQDDVAYRVSRFLDPTVWQDTYNEGAQSYSMRLRTRSFFADESNRGMRAVAHSALIWMKFDDEDGLTITLRAGDSRYTATCTWDQVRQSGMAADNTVRELLTIFAREGKEAEFFDLEFSKVIPSDGDVEFFQAQITGHEHYYEPEYTDGFGEASATFVVEADADPEVDAYS